MKESGIVRNVDVAGRIVIPKEMIYIMAINEGDLLEIVKNNNEIIFRNIMKNVFSVERMKVLWNLKVILFALNVKRI